MRLKDIIVSNIGIHTLRESDEIVMEMANFLADVTELPANIVLWTTTQPNELPHNKYRMKVYKDRIHCATFSIGANPKSLWEVNRKRFQLDSHETTEAIKVISDFSSLFIQYVDGKLTTDDVKREIKKLKKM